MTKHSTLIGGSTAERLLHCPGSWRLIQSLPPQPDSPSEFAQHGTAMHEAMTRIFVLFGPHEELPQYDVLSEIARELVGEFVYDRKITQADLDECILPALGHLCELVRLYDGVEHDDPFYVVGCEMHVKFPGVAGAFGTADLLLANSVITILADWKFGAGVGVTAVYNEPEGDRVNPQLLFYLAAAINTEPELFLDKSQVIAIIQPRVEQSLTFTDVDGPEVIAFVEDVERAVVAAQSRDPKLCLGSWCKFCPAKVVCPEWTGPIKELALLSKKPVEPRAHDDALTKLPTPYATYLGRAKELVEMLRTYADDVDEQIHAYLTAGGQVPGWTLEPKKKLRKWIEADKVEMHLKQLGFGDSEIYRKELQTFAAADAIAKKKGVKIPDHLRVAPPTDETKVVRDLGQVPVAKSRLLEQLEGSLELLRKGV